MCKRDCDEEIKLTYKKLEKSDIPELTLIMKAAFDADTKMHTDLKEGGPNGYDNGELLKRLMNLPKAESAVILADGIKVGGYTVTKDKDIYTLDMLFINPSYNSKGIGSMVWKDIENIYNEAKTWLVETPDYSKRNHHFYEKCGFKKIKEHSFEEGSKSFVFVKQTKEELNDIKHFYIESGEGFPIILLHGNGENSDYFKAQIEEFSRFYHVYAIDTRGHGKTPRGKQPFTIRQFADDLLGFMEAHQIKQAHLLGFSDGGNIAMIFAMKYPERVERLILNGANLNAGGVKTATQLPIEIGYRIAKLFSGKSASAKQNAEMLGLMVNDPNVDITELSEIKAKTLVIAGTKDMIKEKHTKLIAANIADSELVFLEGDHFIANKKAKEFNRAVLEFLKK